MVGEVWGAGKGAALREHGVEVYVGDHVHDVEGARAAGVLSVSVPTGGCTAEELAGSGHRRAARRPDRPSRPGSTDFVLERRLQALEESLRGLGSVLVAFSGGADSALLLAAAVRALGADRVGAATAYSASLPEAERGPAHDFATVAGRRGADPAHARDGARGLPRQRR